MSSIVKDIRDGFEAAILVELTNTWTKIDKKYDLTKNSFKNQSKRFGVIHLDGTNTPALFNHVTTNRIFQVILMQKYVPNNNSDNAEDSIDTLEDAMSEVIKMAEANKFGLSDVFTTTFDGIEAPDLTIENVTVLRANFIIKYKERADNC